MTRLTKDTSSQRIDSIVSSRIISPYRNFVHVGERVAHSHPRVHTRATSNRTPREAYRFPPTTYLSKSTSFARLPGGTASPPPPPPALSPTPSEGGRKCGMDHRVGGVRTRVVLGSGGVASDDLYCGGGRTSPKGVRERGGDCHARTFFSARSLSLIPPPGPRLRLGARGSTNMPEGRVISRPATTGRGPKAGGGDREVSTRPWNSRPPRVGAGRKEKSPSPPPAPPFRPPFA
jgi:hypothetical protein